MDDLVEELQEKLSEQLSATAGSTSTRSHKKDMQKPLVLKQTVCYIVSAVVIEDGKVLMMRESKKSCRGLWYLPAGRVDPNETFVEASRREVLEETGLIFEPTCLVCIEGPSLDWFRFNFTGKITGGKLKTTEDKESIEARWYPTEEVLHGHLPLRGSDICPLIELTIALNAGPKISDPFFSIVPRRKPHSRITIQVILVTQEENGMNVLVDKEKEMGFLHITSTFSAISVKETASALIRRALQGDTDFRIIGIMRAEHNGGPQGVADGTCLTLLAELVSSSEHIKTRYIWYSVNDENMKSKLKKLCEKGCVAVRF